MEDTSKVEWAKTIERERANTHAVFFADSLVDQPAVVAGRIAEGLAALNERAMRAGMIILNTSLLQSAYVTPRGEGHICTTVVCQWMERNALEQMQLQQRLMGQTPMDANGRPR